MAKENIKTLNDALRYNGVTVEQYQEQTKGLPADVRAYIAMRHIALALNEGWVPTFEDSETRWTVWFDVAPDTDFVRCPQDAERWPVKVKAGENLRYHRAIVRVQKEYTPQKEVPGLLPVSQCSRLSFKNPDVALYAGHQFAEMFLTLYFGDQRKTNK